MGFANELLFNFAGKNPQQPTVVSALPISFVQPLLRGGGRAVTLKLANDYPRFKRICARHGIEISATRVRKVVKHFEAERESTRAWRKILEQTTSTLLRQSAQQ